MKVMPLCLCVVRREGKGCCLRWCAFVQSCTVSVQLHPWFGLVALESTSAVQWMERQSLFLCLCQRSLLCLEPKEPSSCSNHSPQPPRPVPPTLVFQHPFFSSLSNSCRLPVCAPTYVKFECHHTHPNNIYLPEFINSGRLNVSFCSVCLFVWKISFQIHRAIILRYLPT